MGHHPTHYNAPPPPGSVTDKVMKVNSNRLFIDLYTMQFPGADPLGGGGGGGPHVGCRL